MNIIFFGSDDFAAVHLEGLLRSSHKVAACVTTPDKARGRGWQISPSPVKERALEARVPVLQPEDLKESSFLKSLKGFNCDLFVVIAYGKFLPAEVLAIPRHFAVNVHGSLLPQYRGAAPINWAVINGEEETGVSLMKISRTMDAGEILAQERIAVSPTDTAVTLRIRMAEIGPSLLLKTIDSIAKNTYTLTPQDDRLVTFAPKLTKELGRIRWEKDAVSIHNLVRGLLPWPAAHTSYQGRLLKILETDVIKGEFSSFQAGEVLEIGTGGFSVAAGKGALWVKKVHLQASKPMEAASFIAGHRLEIGFRF